MKSFIRFATLALRAAAIAFSQTAPASSDAEDSGTSNSLFVMFGSDLVQPGLLPKANYNIGLGRTFEFLKEDPIRDEITLGYIYVFHTDFGSHTEALGIMKSFGISRARHSICNSVVKVMGSKPSLLTSPRRCSGPPWLFSDLTMNRKRRFLRVAFGLDGSSHKGRIKIQGLKLSSFFARQNETSELF